ncbi:MAG: hypothetical protein IJP92_05730 [Lachnospiraceae bacterium]|nr:hypothetical protein [Lachnospiraceae bacterium]
MSPREQARKELTDAGYMLKRHGANHDIYYHPGIGRSIPLKRHQFSENTLRYIRKEIRQQGGMI